MAARLAAALESALEIEVTLVEGHNGIYEISLDDELVYTNRGQCSQGFPDDGKIVELIGHSIGVTPRPGAMKQSQADLEQAPACPLPEQPPLQVIRPATSSGCGCGPTDAPQSDESCCGPAAGAPPKKTGSSGCC